MTSDSIYILRDRILSAWPVRSWDEFNVVVAVSGGGDSVALLRSLHEIHCETDRSKGALIVAHYNHKLRGSDSDGDAAFVSQLADELGLQFHLGSVAANANVKSENQFREQRYEFLFRVARETNSRYIVTAHHRDDQIETVLFRIFRGTGVSGLCGIPATRVVDESLTIVRPMLDVGRDAIEAALESWCQSYRNDVSNVESKFTRNYIRNEVLPMVRARFASVDEAINRLSKQAAQQQEFLHEQMLPLFGSVSQCDEAIVVECESLRGESPVSLRELFIEVFRRNSWPVSQLGFQELDRLARIVIEDGDVPRFQLPGAISCLKQAGVIRIGRA